MRRSLVMTVSQWCLPRGAAGSVLLSGTVGAIRAQPGDVGFVLGVSDRLDHLYAEGPATLHDVGFWAQVGRDHGSH